MSENDTTPEPTDADETHQEETPPKRRLRDRTYGLRGAVAVALAGVILGGIGGTALGFALDDGHGGADHGRHGPPFGRMDDGDRGAPPAPPNGAPNGVPPTTPPEEDGTTSNG